jgi:TolA-binding protein
MIDLFTLVRSPALPFPSVIAFLQKAPLRVRRYPGISRLASSLILLPTFLFVALTQSLYAASPALNNAIKHLQNPATARQGVSLLNTEIQSRDPARAIPAAILLAQHLRATGETGRAVTLMEPYSGFQTNKLQETVFPAYLEYTRCLVAAARVREAVRALDFAKENTQGHQHARVLAAYGDLSGMADDWKVAIEQYKGAMAYGDKFFTRSRTRESQEVIIGPVVPGTEAWQKTHRPAIAASRRHAERQLETQTYGAGFIDYRAARTAHLNKKYADAISLYNALIQQHAGSVYAEAAQLYRAQCLAASGNPQEAMRAMEAFVRAAPLGLYRGEAMYEMGLLMLNQGDVQKAEQHFRKV